MTEKKGDAIHLVVTNHEPCRAVLGSVGALVALEAIKSASQAPTEPQHSCIRFCQTNSPLVRRYHVSERLIKPEMSGEHTYEYNDIDLEVLRNGSDNFTASKEVRKTIIELLEIFGMFSVLVRAEEIDIKVDPVFDSEHVHDGVIQVLKTYLYAGREVAVQNCTETKKSGDTA